MKRIVKIVLWIFGGVVALIVIAAIVLPLVIDPNMFRDDIEAAVEQKTGRDFEMSGDIELSVFPWLGVEIGESRLANAPGFPDRAFAEFESAQISVRLLPLLSKRIEIGTVSLDGLRLRLARNENGETNWDDLVAAFAGEEDQAPAEPTTEGGFSVPEFEIGAIAISDAAVTFRDGLSGETYALSELNLTTGRLTPGEQFPFDLSFVLAAEEMGMTSKVRLVAEILPNLESQFYRFSEVTLNVHAQGAGVPGGEQQLLITGAGELDLKAGRMQLEDLVFQGGGLNIEASIAGNQLMTKPVFNGQVQVKPFNPKAVMQQFGMSPPITQDPDALTSAALETQFQATPTSAQLDQVLIQIDDSTLKGEAKVEGFASPAIAFTLALDHMNLDQYLPPETEQDRQEQEQSQPPAPPGDTQIVLEPLEDLNLNGRVTAAELTVAGLQIQDAELAVTASNGVLRIQPLGAHLYNGTLRMASTVDAAGTRPSYAIQGQLNGLTLGPLLEDLVGTAKVAALANLNIDLTATGNTVQEIKRSLNGNLSFSFQDGAFNGFDLAKILTLARNKLFGGTTDTPTNGETAFSRFAASFAITDGLFRGGDLAVDTPIANLAGQGSFNLVTNQLDYSIKAAIPEGSQTPVLEELAGFTIPINVSGNLFSPSYSLDLSGALKSVAKQKLQEEKAELIEKVQEEKAQLRKKASEEIQEELQEGLLDLFGGGRDKAAPADSQTPDGAGAAQ